MSATRILALGIAGFCILVFLLSQVFGWFSLREMASEVIVTLITVVTTTLFHKQVTWAQIRQYLSDTLTTLRHWLVRRRIAVALFGLLVLVLIAVGVSISQLKAPARIKVVISDFVGLDAGVSQRLRNSVEQKLTGNEMIDILWTQAHSDHNTAPQDANIFVKGLYASYEITREVSMEVMLLRPRENLPKIGPDIVSDELTGLDLSFEMESFNSLTLTTGTEWANVMRDRVPNEIESLVYAAIGTIEYANADWNASIANYEKALELGQEGLSLDASRDATVKRKSISQVHFALGNAYNARASTKRDNPEDPRVKDAPDVAVDRQSALQHYSETLTLDPGFARAYYNRGITYKCTCNYAAARNDFSNAIEHGLRTAEGYWAYGVATLFVEANADGKETASDNFNKALAIDPNYAGAHWGLGYVSQTLNLPDLLPQAIAEYTQTLMLDRDYMEAYYDRARAYFDLGEFESAARDFRDALKLKPDYAEAHYRLGLTYIKLEKYAEAIQSLSQAIANKQDSWQAYEALAEVYKTRGLHEQEKEARAQTHYHRALTHKQNQQDQQALEEFNAAIKIKENFPEAYYQRGLLYEKTADIDKSIEDLEKAIHFRPTYTEAADKVARLLERIGKRDEAISYFTVIINYTRGDVPQVLAEAHFRRGYLHSILNRHNEAISDFTKAVTYQPNYPEAYYNRAHAHRSKSDYDSAIKDFQTAIEQKRDYKEAYAEKALTYYAKQQYHDAIDEYTRVIDNVMNDYAYAYYHRAEARLALNERKETDLALKDLDSAIRYNQAYDAAYLLRGDTRRKLGDTTQAIADFRQVVENSVDPQAKEYAHRRLEELDAQ